MWQTLQTALTPYIFSPLTVLLCLLAAGGWVLGARRLARQGRAPSVWRALSFFTGLLLCYAPLAVFHLTPAVNEKAVFGPEMVLDRRERLPIVVVGLLCNGGSKVYRHQAPVDPRQQPPPVTLSLELPRRKDVFTGAAVKHPRASWQSVQCLVRADRVPWR